MSEAVLRLSGVTREHGQGDVVVQALRGVDLAVLAGYMHLLRPRFFEVF